MTAYELVCVVKPDANAEQIEALDKKINKVFGDFKVTNANKRDWGQRRLAYPIEKQTTAHYFQWVFLGAGGVVSELERQLGYDDQVLRYMTIKSESDAKRDAKPDEFQFGRIDWASAKKTFERRRRFEGEGRDFRSDSRSDSKGDYNGKTK